jgi:anti-sigma factor RsiW
MPCQRYAQSIQDLVDGTLGSIRTAELEQHLETCASCQAFAADMQRIRDLAGSLDRLAPPAGVWLQVAGRLRQEGRIQDVPQAPKGRQARYAILAIAAGLLIAIGGSLFALMPLLRGGGDGAGQPAVEQAAGTPGDAGSVQSIEDHFRIAEQHMQAGIAKLEEAAKADESAMDPQTAAMLKKNLAAAAYFEAQPASYRRAIIWWVVSAKQEETRARRAAMLVDLSARGERHPQFTKWTPMRLR